MNVNDAPTFNDAVEAGARNAYAKTCKTNGPYSLAEYASERIMREQHEMARYVIEGFLSHLAKNAVVVPNVKLRGAPLLARPARTPCYASRKLLCRNSTNRGTAS